MSESLSLRRLSKSFGRVMAVADVTLDVVPGELLVLLGPSGCGKTTVLRLISGLEQPDEGEIRMGESRWNEIPPRERNVAMVFQGNALYPHRTVRGNIEYPLVLRRVPAADRSERVGAIARILHIEQVLDRYPRTLSGGEAQRAALARALVRDPACFLLDEPISSLDPQLRRDARVEIKRLQRELNVLTIYVTHDQEEAIAVGDRIAIMQAGRVVQVGTARDLLTNPRSTFVASFFGNPSMNLLRVDVVDRTDGKVRLRLGEQFTTETEASHWPSGPTTIIMGIRPRDVDIVVTASEHRLDRPHVDGIMFSAVVSLVEGVEPEYIVHCDTPAGPLRVRTDDVIALGEVLVQLRLDRLLFFDADTGMRIGEH